MANATAAMLPVLHVMAQAMTSANPAIPQVTTRYQKTVVASVMMHVMDVRALKIMTVLNAILNITLIRKVIK